MSGSKSFTVEEVQKHNSPTDCWIIISGKVYDVTKFLATHPGGKKPLLNLAGKDATKEFNTFHDVQNVISKYGPQLYVGDIGTGAAPKTQDTPKASPTPSNTAQKQVAVAPINSFGSLTPYTEPSWYHEWHSPYYTESHLRYRAAVRDFVEKELAPYINDWDENKALPREVYVKTHKAGIYAGLIGPPWPAEYAGSFLAGGVKPEEFDAFHELILVDEMSRPGSGGLVWGMNPIAISLPPIMKFGSKYLRDKVCKEILTGEKAICLSITEPTAGSDVSNIQTTAKKTPCGKFYIVNGEKKWMTGGAWADYFTVAVRTSDGSGATGISLLLVERTMPGVSTRHMPCSGMWASGTSYVTYEDVKVPVENLIGEENQGFKYIMYNFNHERWQICVQACRFSRVCFEEAFKYAHKRKTFGKRLVDHPVIRLKLGHMARQIEATQSWLESITHQLVKMGHDEAMKKLAGPISLLKAQCTQTFEFCAREAFQIFGGLAYTRGSQGQKVERLYREVRAFAIAGGSEEIMLDFGVRQAMKFAKL